MRLESTRPTLLFNLPEIAGAETVIFARGKSGFGGRRVFVARHRHTGEGTEKQTGTAEGKAVVILPDNDEAARICRNQSRLCHEAGAALKIVNPNLPPG